MAYENAKAVLKEVQSSKERFNRLCYRIFRLEAELGASGVNYDGMPHGTTPTSPTESAAIQLTEAKRQRAQAWEQWQAAEYKVTAIINSVQDIAQRELLAYRYMEGLQWEEITVRLGYSLRHVHRVHALALCEVQMILGGFNK